jgi:hypothetical protein
MSSTTIPAVAPVKFMERLRAEASIEPEAISTAPPTKETQEALARASRWPTCPT